MTEKKRVIALGFFDGVHLGHSALMKRVTEIAASSSLTPSVITFDTHPLGTVSGSIVPLINSHEDRTGIMHREFGIDNIILLHFDSVTAAMPWDRFIDHLITEFHARHLVAGFDFRFGSGGAGNSSLLKHRCAELGIGCDILPEIKHDGISVSSTYIRDLISEGNIERANGFLGRPHILTDVVRYGYRLGRTLGTPTINMCFSAGVLVPAFGVYATKVYPEDGSEHIGVTNIGVRPTVDSSGQITAETHILNYHGNLYGRRVRIGFHKRLRPEMKFNNTNDLKEQIRQDCGSAMQYFKTGA